MATKVSVSTIANLQNETTAVDQINSNFEALADFIDTLVSRDGVSPNTLTADLDVNGLSLINLGVPTNDTDAARHGDLQTYVDDAEAAQTAAETAQTNAETAETNAETAEANTEALYDDFIPRWLGEAAADPTVDDAGDPVVAGALYFNTVTDAFRVYDGSVWHELPLTALTALSDVVITSVADEDILQYNSGTSMWENATIQVNNGSSTVHARGTVTTAQTPEPSEGQMQTGTNGGAHTLNAPTETGFYRLVYTNNASAGTITASGFDVVVDADSNLTHTVDGSILELNVVNDGVTSVLRVTLLVDAT